MPGLGTRFPAIVPNWLQQVPAIVLVIGPDGCIEQASARAEELLASDRCLCGRLWEEAVPASAIGAVLYGAVGRCRAGERLVECEGPLESPTLGSLWVEWRVAALEPDEADLPRIMVWGVDATSRHALDSELRQLRERAVLGQVISGIAHELRNPLTAVLGFTELLQERIQAPSDRALLQQLHAQAERARRIAANTLAVARPDEGPAEPCDLPAVVAEALDLMQYQLAVCSVAVSQALPPDLPPVAASAHDLCQVLINLLSNAHHALSPGGGQVRISAARSADRVTLSVADDGPGFAPEVLPRIFEPFTSTKPAGQGAGLGLCISRGLVEKHGGTIHARNRSQGGAEVLVELPVLQMAGSDGPRTSCADAGDVPVRPSTQRILVVDDEEALRLLLQEALSLAGHTVDAAGDGEEALALVRDKAYDLVICDLRMPGMDGEEFFDAVSTVAPELSDRIIFSTGDIWAPHSSDFLIRTGLPFLEKPFSIRRMLGLVAAVAGA